MTYTDEELLADLEVIRPRCSLESCGDHGFECELCESLTRITSHIEELKRERGKYTPLEEAEARAHRVGYAIAIEDVIAELRRRQSEADGCDDFIDGPNMLKWLHAKVAAIDYSVTVATPSGPVQQIRCMCGFELAPQVEQRESEKGIK